MIFLKKKIQVLCKKEYGSVHPIISHQQITQIAWGSYEKICSQERKRNARNEEYASLFMEVLGVSKVGWQGSLSLVFVINK